MKRALQCGDYRIVIDGRLIASVERKSLVDLVASLTGGKLRYQIGELAALPRAAVVIEDRYSQLCKLDRVRPAVVATGSPSCRSVGRTYPSCTARLANSPRNGPTGFSPQPTSGRSPNTLFCNVSHRSRSTLPNSMRLPQRRHRSLRRFAPGPKALGCRCLIVGGYAPRSGPPGTTPTHRTEPSSTASY